ncbi:MAG TPA: vanadium-dependent haloperoxidase [Gaiellaceae bacterium]|nr:vanadium-dependent haloperoxidase [Gaiellaceae bacterium]
MVRGFAVALVLVGSLVAAAPTAESRSKESAVEPWIELELDAIAADRVNPPRAARALALTSRAMYEAAQLGDSDRDAAVAGAASTVLAYLFPSHSAQIDALADESESGFEIGVAVGRQMIARAESDGSSAVWDGTRPTGPGLWTPTPPAVAPPLEPLAGTWRTWNLDSGSQFRPGPPPAYGSATFLSELHEVYDVSRTATPEQRAIALFWADGAGTVTPPGHWNAIALDLFADKPRNTIQTTRIFAALNTAQADAFIACWDAKFAYWSIRPVSAIRELLDPAWSPLIVTPPFPSYVSGHSSTSGAASTVLAGFFPSRAAELGVLADEAAMSRLYGGIHFRSDNDAGLALGRRVGEVALQSYND